MTPTEARAKMNLSVSEMAALIGITRQGWHKAERTGIVSEPVARLIAYIDTYGPELATTMASR